jgi:hypothetical protein
MRPGPATQTAFVRGFLLAFVTAWRKPLVEAPLAKERPLQPDSARALSNDECRICQSQLPFAISRSSILRSESRDHELQPLRLPVDHSRSEEQDRGGGRNAQAPSSRRSAFPSVPQRFTLANHRPPLALPQSFGELRNAHVFDEPTFSQIVTPRNTKTFPACAEAVDDAPSLWKPEEI